MVEQFLNEFKNVFAKCAEWTAQLIDAVGGGGVVLAAFTVVLAIALLFIPMRGRMGAISFVSDYQSYSRKKDSEYRKQNGKKGG